MELDIKKKRHSPTRSIQQRNHCAKISASCLPNKSHNEAGMRNDLQKILKSLESFEEAMPDTEKDFSENSDILECLRSLATQRFLASGDLMEFGQSYGCSQTDNTRHMDNNVDETFYNREFLPLQGLTGTVPNYVSVQSDLSKDMGIDFKERQHFATERTHYMQNLNGSVVSRLSLQSDLSKDIGIGFKERQHRGRKR